MNDEHDLTVCIEETETGGYRAWIDEAPERHFAEGPDPMVAVRGALAVAQGTVDSTVDYDRRSDPEQAVSR